MGCRRLAVVFFFSSRRRHTRWTGDWSSDVCSSDLLQRAGRIAARRQAGDRAPVQLDQHAAAAGRLRQRPRREERKSVVGGKKGEVRGGADHKKKKSQAPRLGERVRGGR